MNKSINIQKNLILFGIPLLIIALMVLVVKLPVFAANPNELSIGITVDLLLTAPLVYYLLIRKTKIPNTTVVPFLILGLVIGLLILPSENQYYLRLFKTWVLPIVEISILFYILYKVRGAIQTFKLKKLGSLDFYTTLKNTCSEVLPKALVVPFVTEISVIYYGFLYWKKRTIKENEFTYHKDSGTITLFIAIIFIIGIETLVLHHLLAKWSTVAAWILTILSIYSGIQFLGFLKSMIKRPISIENNTLFLRYGIMNETAICLSTINSVEISSKEIEFNDETRRLSILGELEGHNVIIRLKEENTLTGLYGTRRTYKNIALYVDKKVEFKNYIESYLIS